VNDAVIQEFVEQEVIAQQQVEAAQAKLEAFEAELVLHQSDSGRVTGECWGPVGP
jgi:hypothetical protein